MGMVIDELITRLRFNADPKPLKGARDELGRFISTGKQATGMLGSMRRAMVEAFAVRTIAQGLGSLGSSIIRINTSFQSLKASLKTVTGSAAGAEDAFARIRKFAADTPFQVEELTQAFVKLKALGLEASEGSLKSYGNTASAMGKSLNMMIEAVADASTGEFERLKEFGIKSRSEGNNVSFTFQGVTTTVRKNAKEIEGYLRKIGDTTFAGAMDEQMKTLGGAFSNLEDSAAEFALAIGEGGLNQAIIDVAKEMGAMVGKGKSLAQTIGNFLGHAVRETWKAFKSLLEEFKGIKRENVSAFFTKLKEAITLFSQTLKIVIDNWEILFGLFVGAKLQSAVAAVVGGFRAIGVAAAATAAQVAVATAGFSLLAAAILGAIDAQGKYDKRHKEKKEKGLQDYYETFKDLSSSALEDKLEFARRRQKSYEGKPVKNEQTQQYHAEELQALEDEMNRRLDAGAGEGPIDRGGMVLYRGRWVSQREAEGFQRAGYVEELRKLRKQRPRTTKEKERRIKRINELEESLGMDPTDFSAKIKGPKEKKEIKSDALTRIEGRVEELVKQAETAEFLRREGMSFAERERLSLAAGKARKEQLMMQVNAGNLAALGGEFSDTSKMLRDAGILDPDQRASPPVMTVSIVKADVKVESPITINASSVNASSAEIGNKVREAARKVITEEVATAIQSIMPGEHR